jgi:hypothetical protein
MEYAVQDLRTLMSVAGLLRRYAAEQLGDNSHELFLGTAAALEERAHALAEGRETEEAPEDAILHAPVDLTA